MIELNQIKIIGPAGRETDALAEQLARMIRHYRIPGSVRRRTGINRTQEIGQPWLIVLCTPDTPKDREILAEIDAFIGRNLFSHILTLLAGGTPETSFPEALLHETKPDGTVVEHEPLAANVAGLSGLKLSRRLRVERLRLLAPMLGVSFDDLMNRRHRQRMRIMTALGLAVLALGIAFLTVMIRRIRVFREQNAQLSAQYERVSELAKDAQDAADEAGKSYDAAAAEAALDVLSGGDCELAMLLCLDVLSEMENAPKTAEVLGEALTMRTATGCAPVTAVSDDPEAGAAGAEEPETEGPEAEGPGAEGPGAEGPGAEGPGAEGPGAEGPEAEGPGAKEAEAVIASLPEEYGTKWRAELSCEGYLLGVRGESEILVYDPADDRMLASREAFMYPVTAEDVAFAGEEDPGTGRHGAERIRCGNILYEYRTEETVVPESVEEQIALAEQLLDGRTLSEAERAGYGIS